MGLLWSLRPVPGSKVGMCKTHPVCSACERYVCRGCTQCPHDGLGMCRPGRAGLTERGGERKQDGKWKGETLRFG